MGNGQKIQNDVWCERARTKKHKQKHTKQYAYPNDSSISEWAVLDKFEIIFLFLIFLSFKVGLLMIAEIYHFKKNTRITVQLKIVTTFHTFFGPRVSYSPFRASTLVSGQSF